MTNVDASYNTTVALVVNERCEVIAFAEGWCSAWSVSVLARARLCVRVGLCTCVRVLGCVGVFQSKRMRLRRAGAT